MGIGDKIQTLRIQHGLTGEELASMIGVTQSHISSIERGRRGPSMKLVARIAKALGTSMSLLLEGENIPVGLIDADQDIRPPHRFRLEPYAQIFDRAVIEAPKMTDAEISLASNIILRSFKYWWITVSGHVIDLDKSLVDLIFESFIKLDKDLFSDTTLPTDAHDMSYKPPEMVPRKGLAVPPPNFRFELRPYSNIYDLSRRDGLLNIARENKSVVIHILLKTVRELMYTPA